MPVQPITLERQACLKWRGGLLPLTGPCVIGRRSDNDLMLNDVQVSRRHALLMNFNDEWWLNDLGSRNGVLVNGLRLNSARRMRDGDEIRIGTFRIAFLNSRQGLLHRSTIAGKTTQFAVPAQDEVSPASVICELIITSGQGEILEGEKAARWFFGKKLERAPGAERFHLPLIVRQWLQRLAEEESSSTTPLELQEEGRRVVVSLARCVEDRYFLLLREESAKISIERLKTIGLTEREAEVMHWLCEGKTNPEIVKIFDVTVHTVNRHVEHIFKKLGVDNRQKAIKVVMERLGA